MTTTADTNNWPDSRRRDKFSDANGTVAAIGKSALTNLTDGQYNTAIGCI